MPYYPHTRTFLPCCTPGVLELYCTVGESRLLAQLLCKCTNRVKYYRTVSVDHWVWMMYSICRFCMISHLTGTMKFLPLPWALLPRLSNAITILRRLFISFFGRKSVLPVHALLENRADYVSSLDYHDWQITSHPCRPQGGHGKSAKSIRCIPRVLLERAVDALVSVYFRPALKRFPFLRKRPSSLWGVD